MGLLRKYTAASRIVCFFILICTSCRLGPSYKPPCVESSDEWKTQPSQRDAPFTGLWWQVFNDETLDCLEKQAIANNPNLFATLDRVAQARAAIGIDRAALYPQLNLEPNFYNSGQLFQLFVPPAIFPGVDVTLLEKPFRVLPFNMNYELDLWGRLRGQYESAVFDAQAQREDFHNVLLTLTADVASRYFQMRSLDAQIESVNLNIRLLKQNLDLTQARYKKGLTNILDVVSAEQLLADTQAALEDLLRQRTLQENALATLLGVAPADLMLPADPLFLPPPSIPSGLPSEVMMQRPDIAAAERNMASQHALIGVAYASFFPSFELTGTLGFLSPTFKDFLTWKSRYWLYGANVSLPILDGGRNCANLALSYARYHEAVHEYQDKILTAMQEVENALINVERQALQYQNYQQSLQAAQKRRQIATRRYAQGLSNYLEVIDSERTALQAELNMITVQGQRYASTIQLIKAIGGAWNSPEPVLEEPGCSCQSEEGYDS
jgi:outer membrane protein, multidrug efflux system